MQHTTGLASIAAAVDLAGALKCPVLLQHLGCMASPKTCCDAQKRDLFQHRLLISTWVKSQTSAVRSDSDVLASNHLTNYRFHNITTTICVLPCLWNSSVLSVSLPECDQCLPAGSPSCASCLLDCLLCLLALPACLRLQRVSSCRCCLLLQVSLQRASLQGFFILL